MSLFRCVRLCGLFVLLSALFVASPLRAHEGHDHAPAPVPVSSASPRVVLESETYQLVGVQRGERLTVYLDTFATNDPVRDAKITASLAGGADLAAQAQADGVYLLSSPQLAGDGALEIIFNISGPAGDDLMIGTLERPAGSAMSAAHAHGVFSRTGLIVGAALLGGLALGFFTGRWRRAGVAALAVLAAFVLASPDRAQAHEGHDHGEKPAAIMLGDAPQRLADRSVFLPKASQRLLEIRTRVVAPERAQRSVGMVGRIIADSNRGGLVQSISGGRVIPLDAGLPRIGQSVRRGDMLVMIEPALAQADRTTISERTGEIQQNIAVAEAKLRRLKPLAERGISPQSQIVDAETELEGLRRRLEIVRETRIEPEMLRAPADGVIGSVRIAPGQVVQAQDVLFQIVDPKGMIVEALAFPDALPSASAHASALTAGGQMMSLRHLGFSRALQQQATIVHFAIEDASEALSIGQPVTVLAATGDEVQAVLLPRDAVVRGSNGEALVWKQVSPERFEPHAVRSEAFDSGRVLIRAGLAGGERVVTRGAELINQVR